MPTGIATCRKTTMIKTPRILWIMSLSFAFRHFSRCNGFRIGSTVVHRRFLAGVETFRRKHNGKSLFSTASDEVDSSILYQQFKDLSIEIRKHDELYYGGDTTTSHSTDAKLLSDDEFDALVRKEEELETQFPDLLKLWQEESGLGMSATRSGRVGAKSVVTSTAVERLKRRHLTPMLSLDNVHNEDQLLVWLKRVVKAVEADDELEASGSNAVTIVTEPKLDGVSLSLRYESNSDTHNNSGKIPLELKWASTRGDGTVGQDVTAAAKQMTGIPDTIYLSDDNAKGHKGIVLEVRGEVVLPRSEFLKMKETAQESIEQEESDDATNTTSAENSIVSFANPRNAASGVLLRKESEDPDEQAASKELRSLLRFYAYDLSGLEEEQGAGPKSEMDGMEIRDNLSEWGFALAQPIAVTNLEWEINQMEAFDAETESATEAKALWEDWFQESIANKQIQPILDYFAALEEHRERLQEEDGKNTNFKDRQAD